MTARPLNYTTKIDVKQTVGELTEMLGEHGAVAIGVEYENRKPVGLTFVLDTAIGSRGFRLPVDPAGMHRALLAARNRGDFASLRVSAAKLDQLTSPDHAARVAWRIRGRTTSRSSAAVGSASGLFRLSYSRSGRKRAH